MDVIVALVADSERPFETMTPEEEWARPYQQRRKAHLAVEPDQTLAEVLEAAADQMGLRPPAEHYNSSFVGTYSKVAFYRPDDEHGFAERHIPRYLMSQVTLVDDRGRAVFGVNNLRGVLYRDLLRAAKAGVLDGDPLRPYLMIEVGYGDMPPPDWGLALEGLRAIRETFGVAGDIGGTLALAKLTFDAVRHRLKRGQEALESNAEWRLRGYSPYQFRALILSRDWGVDELAPVLGCTADDARAILWVLGFAEDGEGRWTLEGDEPAQVLQALQHELAIAAHERASDWAPELQRRARKYLESGSPEGVSGPHVYDDYEFPGPTAGERVGEVVDFAIAAGRRLRERRKERRETGL